MQLILYNNISDKRKLNKTITQLSTVEIKLKNENEIVNPTVILSAAYLPPSANYAYIATLKRYYYINGQRILPGNQLELNLSVDVLMSFKDIINNSVVVARRSGTNYNKMLPDIIPLQANRNVLYRKFAGGSVGFGSDKISASSKCYCLSVLNGGINLNPPAGLILAAEGLKIAARWESVTGAFDYDVVYRLAGAESWEHYTYPQITTLCQALITVGTAGDYEVGVAAKDITGGIIGNYKYGTITVIGA